MLDILTKICIPFSDYFFYFRTQNDILTDKDSEHVYELVYSSHRAVAQAAGEFLNEHLFRLDEESATELRSKRGKKRLPNTPLIRDLVQFFIESEVIMTIIIHCRLAIYWIFLLYS